MFFDPGKAVRELGLPQSPIETRARARGRVVPRAGVRAVVSRGAQEKTNDPTDGEPSR